MYGLLRSLGFWVPLPGFSVFSARPMRGPLGLPASGHGCFMGVSFVGVLVIRALLCEVYSRGPHFGNAHMSASEKRFVVQT